MNMKLAFLIAAAAAFLGSLGSTHVFGQSNPAGHWQMVAGNGGDGGAAWKINVNTGESYFCYRQNCFLSAYPPRQ
jgi:hypothetical protein